MTSSLKGIFDEEFDKYLDEKAQSHVLQPLNIRCNGCKRHPRDISAYDYFAELEGISNEEYVLQEEGTYNDYNGHFWCDPCYIKAGQPLGVAP